MLLAVPALAAEWQLRKQADGISVYSKAVPGSKYHAFKGQTLVDATPVAALALLDDTSRGTEWIHGCIESTMLASNGPLGRFIYQVTDLPFPARTRDAIFKAEVQIVSDGKIRVSLVAVPHFIEEDRYIRIEQSAGEYLLEAISDRQTRVTWEQHVDPAGALPSFVVNSMLTDLPYNSLKAFRELVREDRYQRATISFGDSGKPDGLNY